MRIDSSAILTRIVAETTVRRACESRGIEFSFSFSRQPLEDPEKALACVEERATNSKGSLMQVAVDKSRALARFIFIRTSSVMYTLALQWPSCHYGDYPFDDFDKPFCKSFLVHGPQVRDIFAPRNW